MPEKIKRVVIIGPESTGKSTLCKELALHYGTAWCPEYARAYLEENGMNYTYADLLKIAEGQLILEESIAEGVTSDLYFIDTNMYVMKVWCEYVFNNCHPFILEQIAERKYDLYLLCNIDLPWSYDKLREYPEEGPRQELYAIYKELLQNQQVAWNEISGTGEERLMTAIKIVDRFNNQS
ncbi:MAG: ribosylnicotinamide kinase [Chitinophagaceae bacterium]|nr:ribosylnicotinamide kinase [Chitinophagaceae bacterium]